MSQEDLAERLVVSRQAVSKWELDKTVPDVKYIVALSELFLVSTDYLLKDTTPGTDSSASHFPRVCLPSNLAALSRSFLLTFGCKSLSVRVTDSPVSG